MISLSAKIRENVGKKINSQRKKGELPAVVYGPKIKNLSLKVDYKEFEDVFEEVGEASLLSLEIKDKNKKYPVLIHEIQRDPVSGKFLHVDFYQAPLKEKVEATVPLMFEGTSPAVEEKEGTLVENMREIEVKALPQKLPSEIKVDISTLKTFEDHILVKDLNLPKEVEIQRSHDEIVASVTPPEEVEEELEEPIEEKIEEVETVEEAKEREEEEIPTEEGAPAKEKEATGGESKEGRGKKEKNNL